MVLTKEERKTMKKRIIILTFQRISLILGLLILALYFVPMMFGIMPYVVMSGSMEPSISTGSIAYINSNIKAKEIQVGDVIGFNSDNGQVTHRVVEINSNGSFVTKGDNNKDNDIKPVQPSKVEGKTVFSIPFIGRLATFVKTGPGICFVCIYIFLNALCIIFDKKIYNDEEKSKFKEKIEKCDNLDEVKSTVIEEMDAFKEQLLKDVSASYIKKKDQKILMYDELVECKMKEKELNKDFENDESFKNRIVDEVVDIKEQQLELKGEKIESNNENKDVIKLLNKLNYLKAKKAEIK